MNASALGGAKIPHYVSNPVIRLEDGKAFIAAFVYTYNRENLQSNKMPRPIHWIIADIETGEIINEYDCRQKDFSSAGFDALYDLNNPPAVKKPTRDDFTGIYEEIDSLRRKWISGGFDPDDCKKYLDMILEITPGSYQRFYRELANL